MNYKPAGNYMFKVNNKDNKTIVNFGQVMPAGKLLFCKNSRNF